MPNSILSIEMITFLKMLMYSAYLTSGVIGSNLVLTRMLF